MAIETFTLAIGDDPDVEGKNLSQVTDENNTQIVTIVRDNDGFEESSFMFAFWGKDSPTEAGEGPGGDDYFFMDLSGFRDDFHFDVKSMTPGDVFEIDGWDTYSVSGTLHTFTYTGTDSQTHTFTIDAQSQNGSWGIATVIAAVCFTTGTQISVPGGTTAIEDLSAGDWVLCGDGTAQQVRWVGSRTVDFRAADASADLKPILFRKDALGPGQPARDMRLSPSHAVLVSDWRAELFFGEAEVLVAAKQLVNDLTILRQADCQSVEYFHILLDEHQTVLADGMECETLYPGVLTGVALNAEARSEILGLFPDLVTDLDSYGASCRPVLRGFEAQALMHG